MIDLPNELLLKILSCLDTQDLPSSVMSTCQRFHDMSLLSLEKRLKYNIQSQLHVTKDYLLKKEMQKMIRIKDLSKSITCVVLEEYISRTRELNEKVIKWLETRENLSGLFCRIPYRMIDQQDVSYNNFVRDFVHSCVNLKYLFNMKIKNIT